MPAIKDLEIKTGRRTEDIKIRLLALEQDNYILWGRIILHYGISSSGGLGSQTKDHPTRRRRRRVL